VKRIYEELWANATKIIQTQAWFAACAEILILGNRQVLESWKL
jgi:hypothetical protein